MKTKINLIKIGLLISISSVFCLFNSCSLIGFGIGASVDKKKPKTNTIYKSQIDALEIGSKVEIILFGGEKKYGKYGGIVYAYNSDDFQKYQTIKDSLSGKVTLPNQNDTLLIYLISERNVGKLGIFMGFESGKLWYKHFYSDDFSEKFKTGFEKKIIMNGIEEADFGHYKGGDYVSLIKGAIDRSDALIQGSPEINEEILEYAKASGKPMLDYQEDEEYYVAYNEFYDKIIQDQ